MHFPCVRIQENYEDIADIIRMGMMKIRVNHIWYGDYQAQVGACRIGERRLKELVERYGKDTIKGVHRRLDGLWRAAGDRGDQRVPGRNLRLRNRARSRSRRGRGMAYVSVFA